MYVYVYIYKTWNSNTLATSCEELTHWKRPWCWEGLGTGGEGDDRGWDGWMASPTRWTWVWVNSGSWWWTERPGMLQFMASQRVGHNWVTELTELSIIVVLFNQWELVVVIWNENKWECCYCLKICRLSRQGIYSLESQPPGKSYYRLTIDCL